MKEEGVVIIADSRGKGYNFARGVYDYIGKKENRDFPVNIIDIIRTDFRDGEFKIRIAENIRRRKCFFIHDSNKKPCEWYTELNFVLEAMGFSDPSEINVVLPYMRFARQDRKDESRVSVNVKALANMISEYADRGMTVDLHNPAIQEYFDKKVPFDNLYSFPSAIDFIQQRHPEILENLVVVAPDVGGGKRAGSFHKRLLSRGVDADMVIGYKKRKGDNEIEKTMIMGDVKDKNCLIVEDMIDTGGTLVGTGQELKNKGAKRVYAIGAHGLFTEGTEKFKILDKIIVSDTLYTLPFKNLEIFSLVNLFGEAIFRTIVGESLSVLFDDRKVNKM